MTRDEMKDVMENVFAECQALRKAGQAEYSGGADAFGNFNRLATNLRLGRMFILLVYLWKHLDGIVSFVNGHKSQREDVRGRINDAIVYLCLLRGMVDEDQQKEAME